MTPIKISKKAEVGMLIALKEHLSTDAMPIRLRSWMTNGLSCYIKQNGTATFDESLGLSGNGSIKTVRDYNRLCRDRFICLAFDAIQAKNYEEKIKILKKELKYYFDPCRRRKPEENSVLFYLVEAGEHTKIPKTFQYIESEILKSRGDW